MKSGDRIEVYAVRQLDLLLNILATRINQAAEHPGADEIHDLRVSMRRLSQGVEFFGNLFPAWDTKEILKTLKGMMRLTSEVRNRDIALDFLVKENRRGHRVRLRKERAAYQRQLSVLVRRWRQDDFTSQWRSGLPIGPV